MSTSGYTRFDFADLTPRDRYKLLIGTVVPRPIALITTISPDGIINAAPYSFFNCLSADPAILAIGVENHADMSFKDTAHNIRMTEEFTVNIVDDAMAEAMNICAVSFPSGTNELDQAGLEAIDGTHVVSPRIASAPAAFECRRHMTLELGKSREIILGEVKGLFLREDLVDTETKYVDQLGLDAIGRMGGHGYSRTRDLFDLKTPSLADWEQRQPLPVKTEVAKTG